MCETWSSQNLFREKVPLLVYKMFRKLNYFPTVIHKYSFRDFNYIFSGRTWLQLFSPHFSVFAGSSCDLSPRRTNPLFARPRLHPGGQECGQGTNLQQRLQFQGVPEFSTLFNQIIPGFCRRHPLFTLGISHD